MGHAWLPCWLIRDRVRAGDLVELWLYRPSATVECYAVWPVAQYLPLRSRLAIDAPAADLPKRFDS
jgi:DNA-binding transcriptional LysR family regulator